jgi:hypothetical protein
MLARGQLNAFLFNEILLIETAILPLVLLRRDRRTFHRNMFTRAKMLNEPEHREYVQRKSPVPCKPTTAPRCGTFI